MYLKHTNFVFTLLLMGFVSYLTEAQFNSEVEANINIVTEGILTKINFSAYNKTSLKKSLSYRALITKNRSNESSEEQFEDEQYFILEAGERKNISTASVDLSQGQRTIVFVLIYEDNKVIGKDRIVINGFQGEDDMKPSIVEQDNLLPTKGTVRQQDVDLMTGLVFENTKTKPGRDFFQMFYLAYNANNIKGTKMVKVDEVLSIGGNTQMRIYAGDDLVVQFFVNPRSTYIKEMVDQSIIRINHYFQNSKAIRQNTIQY